MSSGKPEPPRYPEERGNVAELAPDHHVSRFLGTYGEKMPKPIKFLIASGVGFATILIVVVIVSSAITRVPDMPPDKRRLPQQALTPEEITLSVAPQTDGTLHVSERLIFDATKNEDRPIRWYIGGESIGWQRDGPEYFVVPKVLEVAAQELSTGQGSTKDDPAVAGDLTVSRDDSEVDDPFHDSVSYEFTNPNPPDEDSQWRPGRHVVDISYVLDNVYLDVEGQEFFALPMSFPDGTDEAASIRTVSLSSGGPIRCIPSNRSFRLDNDCSGWSQRRLDKDGTRLTWRRDLSDSLDAIGFDAPMNMQAEPSAAPEKRS